MLVQSGAPLPCEGERPTNYAERLGQWYAASASSSHRKEVGQYFTPASVAEFMAGLYKSAGDTVRVLDPGAGVGILSSAVCESLATRQVKPVRIELEAYESDPALACHLESSLLYLQRWLHAQGIDLNFRINADDFVIAHAEALNDSPRLFAIERGNINGYDVIISNPPYFKLPKSDSRARASAAVVHGQPNIYSLFMAISARLLKQGGELIFITPRSYASGSYFRLFRERFFTNMQPKAIHLFDSRRAPFNHDGVLQENVILLARRSDSWLEQICDDVVEVSGSAGVQDLSQSIKRRVALSNVIDFRSPNKILSIPVIEDDEEAAQVVLGWKENLRAYGLEISTGPVVPFRAVPSITQSGNVPEAHAPLLWMQNVTAMYVTWPTKAGGKKQYIKNNESSKPLLLSNKNYVLLRRFSSKEEKRRLIAAPFLANQIKSPFIGLENHLNYVHRPGGSMSEEEVYGLAALFNSTLLDTYFRTFSGNTQVSATELRMMPLPSLDLITEVGRKAMVSGQTGESLDDIVASVLSLGSNRFAANKKDV